MSETVRKGFVKGMPSANPHGRPKGAKSIRTQQWERLGRYLIEKGAERFIKVLQRLPDEEYIDAYSRIIKYFKPQLKQVDANLNFKGRPLIIGFAENPDDYKGEITEGEIIENDDESTDNE